VEVSTIVTDPVPQLNFSVWPPLSADAASASCNAAAVQLSGVPMPTHIVLFAAPTDRGTAQGAKARMTKRYRAKADMGASLEEQ
jgi:hypothetical protein